MLFLSDTEGVYAHFAIFSNIIIWKNWRKKFFPMRTLNQSIAWNTPLFRISSLSFVRTSEIQNPQIQSEKLWKILWYCHQQILGRSFHFRDIATRSRNLEIHQDFWSRTRRSRNCVLLVLMWGCLLLCCSSNIIPCMVACLLVFSASYFKSSFTNSCTLCWLI